MANEEDCAKGCKEPVVALERKIVQVLMEVLMEEDWSRLFPFGKLSKAKSAAQRH
jgi:hypothetical protein